MSDKKKSGAGDIEPSKGKLGIMMPGMGAVATTFVAGVEAVRKGIAKPIGSLTQMGTVTARQAHRRTLAEDQRVRPSRAVERPCLYRLGYF